VGISMDAVTQTLLVDGAKLFGDAFTQLMDVISGVREKAFGAQKV